MKWWLSVTVLGGAISAFGQPAPKPWLLPLEERIAARTNVTLARERLKQAAAGSEQGLRQQSTSLRAVDELSGSTHPELFLPHELFRKLVALAFLSPSRTAELFREGREKKIAELAFPADFWDQLRSLSSAYMGDLARDETLGRQQRGKEGRIAVALKVERAAALRDLCRSRAGALAEARRTFGQERFDRFLYESIAPHMHIVTDTLPNPADLTRLEQGCP